MVTSVKAWLKKNYYVTVPDDWLQACVEWVHEENQNSAISQQQLNSLVFDQWLVADLRELQMGCLPADVTTAVKYQLSGFYCLQVDSIINVSTAYYTQLQKAKGADNSNMTVSADKPHQPAWQPPLKRMLMLKMTDGTTDIQGMEYETIPDLSTELSPGVKILVHGNVLCRRGVLLLTSRSVRVLGGEVDSLMEANTQINLLQSALQESGNFAGKQYRKEYGASDGTEIQVAGLNRSDRMGVSIPVPSEISSGVCTAPLRRHLFNQDSFPAARTNAMSTVLPHAEFSEIEEDIPETFFDQEWNDDDINYSMLMDEEFAEEKEMAMSSSSIPSKPSSGWKTSAELVVKEDFVQPMESLSGVGERNRCLKRKLTLRNRQNFNMTGGQHASANCFETHSISPEFTDKDQEAVKTLEKSASREEVIELSDEFESDFETVDLPVVCERAVDKPLGSMYSGNDSNFQNRPLENESGFRNNSAASSPDSLKTRSGAVMENIEQAQSRLQCENFKNAFSLNGMKNDNTNPEHATVKIVGTKKVGELTMKTAASGLGRIAFDSQPFTYLSVVQRYLPIQSTKTFCVKAYVSTLLGRLEHREDRWSLSCKISDGTGTLDVDLSDTILSKLIGFTAERCLSGHECPPTCHMTVLRKKKTKKVGNDYSVDFTAKNRFLDISAKGKVMKGLGKEDTNVRAMLQQGIQQCQQKLVDLSCICEIEVSAGHPRPVVQHLHPITAAHQQQLYARVAGALSTM